MDFSSLYNRFLYRDLLGYGLPGAIFVISFLIALSPIEINNNDIDLLKDISFAKIVLLIGLGFIFAHLVSVIPRYIFRKKCIRKRPIQKALDFYRTKAVMSFLIEGYDDLFGKGAWERDDVIRKREILFIFVKARNIQTDMLYRITSMKIFLENSTFLLPPAMILFSVNMQIPSISLSSCKVFLIIAAIILGLSIWGRQNVEMFEDREIFMNFLKYYMREKY